MTTYAQRYATADSNTAGAFEFEPIAGKDYGISKIMIGTTGVNDGFVSSANPMPVTGTLTAVTTVTTVATVTNLAQMAGAAIAMGTGVRSAGTQRVTIATDDVVPASQSGTWTVGISASQTLANVTTLGTITNVVHVDDNSGSLTVDNAGTFAVQATIAAGATAIGKAEDVASADADVGVPAMAVRKATPANTSGTDGDYEMLQISAGRLWCSVTVDAALPAGTNAIGKLAANAGVTIGAVEIAASQTLATLTTITNVVHVDDNSGSLTVDAPVGTPVFVRLSDGSAAISTLPVSLASVPSHAVTNAGTFAVQIDAGAVTSLALIDDVVYAEDAASANADKGVMILAKRSDTPANTSGTDGDYEPLQVSGGRLHTSTAIASGQTLDTVTTVTTVTTCSTVTTLTGGGVAHDGADSGNPHKMGAKATTSLSGLTLVANADRTDLFAGVDGVQVVRPHCNLEDIVSGNASNTDGTSTQCIAAQSSGIKTYLTSIILTNMSTTGIYVEIKDGTTVKVTIPLPASSGAIFNPPVPIPGTAATAWNFDPSASATTVYCSMVGFKSKV